jgi:dTDP-4-amino-4,6-dideoxygalactose transaminase
MVRIQPNRPAARSEGAEVPVVVPFLDLAATHDEIRDELRGAVHRVIDSGHYILGREVEAFEQEFAAFCEVEHCVAVGNGLDALHIALLALGIGPGDEVIVPVHTFIATWLAVSATGATPVGVEPDERTYTIDATRIEAAISPRTRAIIPVHLYGMPADMNAIRSVADRHRLYVLEDAAQAHGARYNGARVGALGEAAAFSFYPGKNLGAMGDGGAITTRDRHLADTARKLRNYGSLVKYVHERRGMNSRLDEMQAAILRAKLPYLEAWNRRRAELAAAYLEQLAGSGVQLPSVPSYAEPVWHLFVIRARQREGLRDWLRTQGIESAVHYPIPPHLQAAYEGVQTVGAFPLSEQIARECLSLPIGPALSPSAAARCANAVKRFHSA